MAKGAYIGVSTPAHIGDLAAGSTVRLNVSGVATEFVVVHQGNPNATMYDSSCDGTWLLMKDIYEIRKWHNTDDNQYATSDIHNYLNSDFLGQFDSTVQNAVKEVKIPYGAGAPADTVYSGASGMAAKIFLLSNREVGYTSSDFIDDGAKLDFFQYRTGDNTDRASRIAYLNGVGTIWWLRSPRANTRNYVVAVLEDGEQGSLTAATSPIQSGVRPALILPSNLGVINGFVDGHVSEKFVGRARKIKKGYVGVRTIKNLFDENESVCKAWNGGERPDVNYKNADGTFTFKNNFSTIIYGQDLYGKVEAGKSYTMICEIVSAKCPAINIGMECNRDGSRWFDNSGNFPPVAGSTISRVLTVPDGCTVILFSLAMAGYITDGDEHITVKNIRIVEGAWDASTIHLAGSDVARRIKKAYIGISAATYREVEYIENSGTQYINTLYMPNQNTRVVVDFSPTTTAPRVFGTRVGYNNRSFLAMVKSGGIINGQIASTTTGIDYDIPDLNVSIGQRVTLVLDKNELSCGGKKKEFNFTSEFTAHDAMPLFGLKLGNDLSISSGIRLYSCQIYDNGDLVRDYVPCISANGSAGLFDKVNKEFYENAGSGNFATGLETGATHSSSMGVAHEVKISGEIIEFGWRGQNWDSVCKAEEGMTWAEFVNSDYNVVTGHTSRPDTQSKFTISSDGYVFGPDGYNVWKTSNDSTFVKSTDVIIPGNVYDSDW